MTDSRTAPVSGPTRCYVLDTSVLLSDPWSLTRFDEHEVVLPLVVISELEGKRNHPELGWFARTALRTLDELRIEHGRLDAPVPIAATPARSRSRSRTTMLVAAAVAIVFAGAVTTAALLGGRGSGGPDATVALAPVSDQAARGSVAMTDVGVAQAMEVDTSLGAAPPDAYYEVWLLDRDTGKMLPVGVLPPDGRGTYRLPGSLLEQYDTVDISLQPDDGSTAHSSDSVLRADYA